MDLIASTIAPPTLPISLPKPAASAGAAVDTTAARTRIDKTSKDFEASFLSVMLGQMFDGVKASTFGGGQGEEAFKSFLTDAMAKSMVRHGGVGLSKSLAAEMMKMQGLSAPTPVAAAASAYTQGAVQ